jgi:AraC-like DNA-binding protein
MPPKRSLIETDIRSPATQMWTVRADADDLRPWMAVAPVCPPLATVQMLHVGCGRFPAPFEIVRTQLGGSYFLACLGGTGQLLVDGRWQRCRSGQAFLLPPGTLNAFRTTPGRMWEFCWVRYARRPEQQPMATAQTPVFAEYDGEPLRHAVLGLHREATSTAAPATLEQWVRLIHGYVLRFAQPHARDRRIARLWDDVERDLAREWTSAELSKRVHLSEKQLERLCRRELGRTPHQQLIWLRMRRAAELLTSSEDKIETIAGKVGYRNPFVFSTTFKRCLGWSPSAYPGRR